MGLGFISVVKQESRNFPMAHLQRKDFNHRGNHYGLMSEEAN